MVLRTLQLEVAFSRICSAGRVLMLAGAVNTAIVGSNGVLTEFRGREFCRTGSPAASEIRDSIRMLNLVWELQLLTIF